MTWTENEKQALWYTLYHVAREWSFVLLLALVLFCLIWAVS